MPKTIIQLEKETVDKLKKQKKYARQTYDEVINELLAGDALTDEELDDLREGLEDLRKNRVKPIEQVAHDLNVKLK